MRKKNLITWKDADRNLCRMAASMLHSAGIEIRSADYEERTHETTDGDILEAGIGSSYDRTWWSGSDPYNPPPIGLRNSLPPLCWWSFQNLIRMRLQQARQELAEAIYGQEREIRQSKQRSRNPNGRKPTSKFGWQAE